MDLIVSSRAVLGFNLSFFAFETGAMRVHFDSIVDYVERGVIRACLAPGAAPASGGGGASGGIPVAVGDLRHIRRAHEALMSGRTCGKLVLCPGYGGGAGDLFG
jgi:hypothetical protein